MSGAYYNEHDKFAAAWLRELIKAGLIADGEVDERDIQDVRADDLRGFVQCHFFAGIGGWSYALRLAGWPDDRPVWTGSCPCQPFSQAKTNRRRTLDARDLWPIFFRLIGQQRPGEVFGEQVAGTDGFGWWDRASSCLETQGYAVAAVDLVGTFVGSLQTGARLFFVASADGDGRTGRPAPARWQSRSDASRGDDGLERIACADGKTRAIKSSLKPLAHGLSGRVGRLRGYGNAIVPQVAAAFIQAYCECCEVKS